MPGFGIGISVNPAGFLHIFKQVKTGRVNKHRVNMRRIVQAVSQQVDVIQNFKIGPFRSPKQNRIRQEFRIAMPFFRIIRHRTQKLCFRIQLYRIVPFIFSDFIVFQRDCFYKTRLPMQKPPMPDFKRIGSVSKAD